MFTTAPAIDSHLDAIDELDDVQRSLEGLSQIVLALETANLAEKEALDLIARLLGYCALSLETTTTHFEATTEAEPIWEERLGADAADSDFGKTAQTDQQTVDLGRTAQTGSNGQNRKGRHPFAAV